MTITTNSHADAEVRETIQIDEPGTAEVSSSDVAPPDAAKPQRSLARMRRKAGIHEPPKFRPSRHTQLAVVRGARIEGIPIAKQRDLATIPVVEIYCGTSLGSVVAPAGVKLDRLLGQRPLRVTIDADERPLVVMRDDALTITLDTSRLGPRAKERLEHDPGFVAIYDAFVGADVIYDDLVPGHGSSNRLRTALAYYLALEPLETVFEELADALAPDQRRTERQNILTRVATHLAASRPDRRMPIVRIKAGLGGRSGNVIAVLCAAQLRAVFDARGVNATIVLESYGPTAFTEAYAATDGQPAFDHAAATSLELEAITASAAEAFGIGGQRLFDFQYLVDLPYRLTEGGELIAPPIADLERWLAQQGGVSSLMTTLHTEGQLISDALTIRSARPDEGRGCVSTLGARVIAVDRMHLREGALDVAVRDALRDLSRQREVAAIDGTEFQRAEAEGRAFAATLLSADVATLVARSHLDESGDTIEPVSYALPGAHDGDEDLESSRDELLAGGLELISERERYAAQLKETLDGSVARLFAEQRTRILQALQARQADDQPVGPWLRGVSAAYRMQLDGDPKGSIEDDSVKAARDLAQDVWVEADEDAARVEAKLERVWFWENERELLRKAERRFNAYSAAWFSWYQLQRLSEALREEISWLERFDEMRAVAAQRARLALDQLEPRIAARPNAPIDAAGLGSGENDLDLAEAVAGSAIPLDPADIAALPEGDPGATIAVAREAVTATVLDRLAAVETVQDALSLKVRVRFPELDDEEVEALVWDEIGAQLIPAAQAMTDASNARFGIDAHTSHYLLTNQDDVPALEGNVVVERLDPERFAPDMPFLAFIRVQHGARLESLPWYGPAVQRLLARRDERGPFIVQIAEDYLDRLA